QRLHHVLRLGGHHEKAGGPADAVRGVARERLVLEHTAAELDLRRWRRGRCGRGLRLRAARGCGALRYVRTAGARLAAFAAGDGLSTVVFSCHSWRLLTLPVRLRSAMIASHAALAADIVVVYGTRCISAARRIAESLACVNFPGGGFVSIC